MNENVNDNIIKNKSVVEIEKDLESVRKENLRGNWYSDEMRIASTKVSSEIFSKIIDSGKKIQNFSNKMQRDKFLQTYNNLNMELNQITSNLSTKDYMFRHKIILNDIAHKIDNAENDMIKIIEQVRKQKVVKKEKIKENKKIKEINDSNNYFDMSEKGILKLNKNTNQPRIDQVLGELMNEKNTRLIDYSECTNSSIKSRMVDAIGGTTCYIVKGQDSNGNDTYVLKNRKGEKLDQRALIWEGVTLTSDLSLQDKALNKLHIQELEGPKKQELSEQNINNLKNIVPSKLKTALDESYINVNDFIKESDTALDKVIIDAKKHGWELRAGEPISKLWFSGGLMEAHFINDKTTVSKGPILGKNGISSGLYKVLDKNEGSLKDYLTVRIKQKWDENDHLTKRTNILSEPKKGQERISDDIKNNALYGLGLVDNLIKNLRDDKGDTWGKKDKRIVEMQKFVKDALYSINSGNPTEKDLKNIENKLRELFFGYYFANRPTIPNKNVYTDIIFGGKEKAIAGVRKLAEHMSIWDNTYTTFLRDEIMEHDDFEIKNTEYQGYFNKISELFSIPDDSEDIPENIITHVDDLMNIVKTDKTPNIKQSDILSYLKGIGILPQKASMNDKEIKEGCEKLYHIFENKNKTINSLQDSINFNSMKESLEYEKLVLESKPNKTEDEIIRLNSLLSLLENDAILKGYMFEHIETVKMAMLYGGVDDEIKGCFGSWLAKQGGGVNGTNSAIFNDSIGAGGLFDRSDENAAQIGPMLQMMVTELAICLVAITAGAATGGAATAWIYGARIAAAGGRVARLGGKAKTFRLLLNLNKAKEFRHLGNLKIAKDVEKFQTLSRWAKVKNIITPSLHGSIGNITAGLTYATTTTTLRNQWEDMTLEKFGSEVFLGASMIGILGIAGKIFPGKNVGSFFKRVFTEETGINTADFGKIRYN